jgi:hypothetical protein
LRGLTDHGLGRMEGWPMTGLTDHWFGPSRGQIMTARRAGPTNQSNQPAPTLRLMRARRGHGPTSAVTAPHGAVTARRSHSPARNRHGPARRRHGLLCSLWHRNRLVFRRVSCVPSVALCAVAMRRLGAPVARDTGGGAWRRRCCVAVGTETRGTGTGTRERETETEMGETQTEERGRDRDERCRGRD